MNSYSEEKSANETLNWTAILRTFISLLLGGGALWFSWVRYNSLLNRPEVRWYEWTQPVLAVFMGILCLSASALFLLHKPSGWSIFKAGLSIIPLMLFTNLLILLFRVIQNIFQGNGLLLLSRLYASPLNKALLVLVVILILLSVVKETRNERK